MESLFLREAFATLLTLDARMNLQCSTGCRLLLLALAAPNVAGEYVRDQLQHMLRDAKPREQFRHRAFDREL